MPTERVSDAKPMAVYSWRDRDLKPMVNIDGVDYSADFVRAALESAIQPASGATSRRAADKEPGTGEDGLLPCPFCGDPMCLDGGELQHALPGDGICPITAYAWAYPEAIAAWNRRAHTSPAQGVSEAMVSAFALGAQMGDPLEPAATPVLERARANMIKRIRDGLTAALGAQPAEVEGWQDISTAPRDGPAYLVWCPERRNIYLVLPDGPASIEGGWTWAHFGGGARMLEQKPTRWRLLPTPPADEATP